MTLSGPIDFHAAAAQIIPVLFLAMSFESKIFQRKPDSYLGNPEEGEENPAFWNPFQIVAVLALLGFMVISELAALIGLYAGGSPMLDAVVWLGLVSGVLGVVLPLAAFQRSLLRTYLRAGSRKGLASLVFLLVVFLVGIVFLAVQMIGWIAQGLERLGA